MHDSNFVVKLQNVFRMVYLLQFYVLILYFFELGYRSRALYWKLLILHGKGKTFEQKKSLHKRLYPLYNGHNIYSWVEKSDSFCDGVAASKKDWATEKSRVTNGVNSSTRNSLIGVSDISFRWCMERGGERGWARSRKPSTDHCPPSVPSWTPLWRSRTRQKLPSSCQRVSFC